MNGESCESKVILRNIINLSISEIVSRLLNFISFVYLARIILAEGFGIISFVLAFSSYFLLTVNFSSDIIASRETARLAHSSLGQGDSQTRRASLYSNVSTFVSKIISLRIILACVSYALLTGLVLSLSQPETIKIGLMIYGLAFFAHAINISWYYRGLEKTLPITISQIFSSLINLLLIIALINNQSEIITAVLIMTCVSFLNSLLLLILYGEKPTRLNSARLEIRPMLDIRFIGSNLKESFPVAIAGIMISIYYNLDHVMLGYMTNSAELGYYAAAYKIIVIALVPAGIIYQAFFPQLALLRSGLSKSMSDLNCRSELMEMYSMYMLTAGAFFTTIVFLFAKEIIEITYGKFYGDSILLAKILALNIFFVYLNMSYGNPLIAWDKQKIYSYSIVLGAVTNIILNVVLIPGYHAIGAAISTISSEVAVMAGILPTHFSITKRIHTAIILKSIACGGLTVLVTMSVANVLTPVPRVLISLILFSILSYILKLTSGFRMKSVINEI